MFFCVLLLLNSYWISTHFDLTVVKENQAKKILCSPITFEHLAKKIKRSLYFLILYLYALDELDLSK